MANVVVLETSTPLTGMERISGEAVTPGHLVEITTGNLLQKHASATGASAKLFALEATWSVAGNNLTGPALDEEYPSGDTVAFFQAKQGDLVNALLAAGQNADEGNQLASNGDGTLRVSNTNPVARCEVAVNNSGGSSAVRIKARVI